MWIVAAIRYGLDGEMPVLLPRNLKQVGSPRTDDLFWPDYILPDE